MTKPSPQPAAPLPVTEEFLALVKFDAQGLVPVIVQEGASREVLVLCYMNREALVRSLAEGRVYVFRRSQGRLMLKGETSGHIEVIREVAVDCEGKSILMLVEQRVAACHTGFFSCYFRRLGPDGRARTVGARVFDPDQVYKKAG